MTDPAIGLYLHIPFCERKCAYCDFYSAFATEELLDRYAKILTEKINEWGGKTDRPISTVYFGGGTPSLLGNRILPVMEAVRRSFSVAPDAEITAEVNPSANAALFLSAAKEAGVNRLSIGAQSGDTRELSLLGRRHTAADTLMTVEAARKAGFDNLSLDLMLGLPFSTQESTGRNIGFILSARPEHISAYLLTIEPNTLFYKKQADLSLPDEEALARQYRTLCETLKQNGYRHYEISNFCRDGYESRHNLLYWQDREYIGIGPAAHSFYGGKRFYYPRDLRAFLAGNEPVPDGTGGDLAEYVMLSLRLSEGVRFSELKKRFSRSLPFEPATILAPLIREGLLTVTGEAIALTEKGMLLSNSVIAEILNLLESEGAL